MWAMTSAELPGHRPYYFFVVIVIRYETAAAARWALLFIVRTFFNDAFAIALWAGFHTRLTFRVIVLGKARFNQRQGFSSNCIQSIK